MLTITTTTLYLINPMAPSGCSCGNTIELQFQGPKRKLRKTTTLTLQSKTSIDINHFKLLWSPKPKAMTNLEIKDCRPHHNHNHKDLHKRKCELNKL